MNRETTTCEAMQERLTARLAGALAPAELAELEAHLAVCAVCAAEAAGFAALWQELGEPGESVPSERMRARLDAVLASEVAAGRQGVGAQVLPLPQRLETRRGRAAGGAGLFDRRLFALAAMLLVGLGLGYLAFGRGGDDVATLRREVGDLHTMVALSLLEKSSVSERLQGVAYSRDAAVSLDFGNLRGGGSPRRESRPDSTAGEAAPAAEREQIVAALFARLLEDPNVNVRLAALEALRPLAARDDRRSEFVAAVARQDSPLVALSLIDLLLESGTAAARHDLEQLLANDQLDPVVRGYLRDRLGRSA